ncbi:hypothetical protein GP486_007168 [Trichoglossum hirsutum]|uniref:Uncharacterized protein n=1 Tax=Trichoglossum hirsutum TaxID=265104 RepID=A0A9P8IGA1_9PEZI|nr:hypothetical protein GP486_007168 [Trichoglossum hirsutum]
MDLSDGNSSTPRGAANGYAPAPALASDDNATNRRKSVRVVRKPKLFVQEPVVTKSAKRKRAEVQAEDDASGKEEADEDEDEHDDDETEESEGEADAEELKERKRRDATKRKTKAPTKPAAKKAKKTRAAPAVAARRTSAPKGVNGPAPKARRGRPRKAISSGGVEGLYVEVFSRGKTLDAVAAEWMSNYQRSAPEAMRDIVNFVLRCAGCELEVTVHDIEDQDNVTGRLSDLQDEYQAVG